MELRGVNITNTNIIAGSGGPAPSGDNVIGFAEMVLPLSQAVNWKIVLLLSTVLLDSLSTMIVRPVSPQTPLQQIMYHGLLQIIP